MDFFVTIPRQAAEWISDKVAGCEIQLQSGSHTKDRIAKLKFPPNVKVTEIQALFRRASDHLHKCTLDKKFLHDNLPLSLTGARDTMAKDFSMYFFEDFYEGEGSNKALMRRLKNDMGTPLLPDRKRRNHKSRKIQHVLLASPSTTSNKRQKSDSTGHKTVEEMDIDWRISIAKKRAALSQEQAALSKKRAEIAQEQAKLASTQASLNLEYAEIDRDEADYRRWQQQMQHVGTN